MMRPPRKPFLLALSLGVGLLLTGSLAALGGPTKPSTTPGATADPAPSSEPLAVFSRPRTGQDVLPPDLAASVTEHLPGAPPVPEELWNGRLYLDQSRLLLASMGSSDISLYAFPSEKGGICVAFDRWGGGCLGTPLFTRERPIDVSRTDPDGLGGGMPLVVSGLAPNNVVAVDVLVGDKAYAATLRNNAFFLEMPSAAVQPDGVRVTFRGGATTAIALSPIPSR
jgi:hypothetical protein